MVGFAGTSNVAASAAYGLPAVGTMAHSFIGAFPDEAEAFRTFARNTTGPVTLLVDTYDTERGVRIAAGVLREFEDDRGLGVRLDRGDLSELASYARRTLDAAGLTAARIVVRGGLDEYGIEDLVAANAPIDLFAVGTKVGTSADAPYLDLAYKLVEYAGRPVMKLSAAKLTAPAPKQIFRRPRLCRRVGGSRRGLPDGRRAVARAPLSPALDADRRRFPGLGAHAHACAVDPHHQVLLAVAHCKRQRAELPRPGGVNAERVAGGFQAGEAALQHVHGSRLAARCTPSAVVPPWMSSVSLLSSRVKCSSALSRWARPSTHACTRAFSVDP